MAKKKRILLGSTAQDEERRKLFLRTTHLPSVVLPMLAAVIVIWWWTCGLPGWSAVPATTASISGVIGPTKKQLQLNNFIIPKSAYRIGYPSRIFTTKFPSAPMAQDFPSLCTFTKLNKLQLLYPLVDPAKSGCISLSQLQFTYHKGPQQKIIRVGSAMNYGCGFVYDYPN